MYIIGEKKVNIRQHKEVNVFYHFLYLSAAFAAYLMTMTLVRPHVALLCPIIQLWTSGKSTWVIFAK
jgi:hypothetical protein